MIKLFQFAPAWDLPNLSPFCMKLETYLKMAGLPYELAEAVPLQAPKGQLPFIEDKGRRIGDSQLIIEYLKQTYGDKVDAHLTPADRAVSNAVQRLIENHLFWAFLFARWGKRDENWAENKRAIFGSLPPVARDLVAALARRHVLKEMHGHGMGRHTEDEIYGLGRRDLDALSDYLEGKPWFAGERPATVDASAFGLLANILWCPIESPLKEHLGSLENLTGFCERMRERYYAGPAATESAAPA